MQWIATAFTFHSKNNALKAYEGSVKIIAKEKDGSGISVYRVTLNDVPMLIVIGLPETMRVIGKCWSVCEKAHGTQTPLPDEVLEALIKRSSEKWGKQEGFFERRGVNEEIKFDES